MSRENVSRDGMRRRDVLATLGASAAVGLAGCGGDAAETPTTTARTDRDPTGSATPSPTETATDTATDPPPTETEEPVGNWSDGGPPDRDEWTVTFADRFEGGELDTGRWSYGMGGGTVRCPPQDAPDHCWAEDHVWVDDEEDRLMVQASDEEPEGDADYTFGAVTSDPHFTQEYGYFEARCRMGDANGTLPAFWMLTDFTEHNYRELTFETRGVDEGETLNFGFFIQDDEGTMHQPPSRWDEGYSDFDHPLDEAFHTLGIEWRPDSLAFHVDGEEIGRWDGEAVTDHLPGAPMYLICTHGVMEGADWVGYPEDADFPTHTEVEWVRAWQHDEWA